MSKTHDTILELIPIGKLFTIDLLTRWYSDKLNEPQQAHLYYRTVLQDNDNFEPVEMLNRTETDFRHLYFYRKGATKHIDESVYTCSECGANRVKMWRPYSFTMPDLRCTACMERAANKKWDGKSHSIGWHVPAVPYGDAFWGYSSVPPDACAWWENLPDYKE